MALDKDFVRKELEKLPKDFSIAFAYRCALRALPILAVNGGFEYWRNNKEKYLFSVLYALDKTEGFCCAQPKVAHQRGLPSVDEVLKVIPMNEVLSVIIRPIFSLREKVAFFLVFFSLFILPKLK